MEAGEILQGVEAGGKLQVWKGLKVFCPFASLELAEVAGAVTQIEHIVNSTL